MLMLRRRVKFGESWEERSVRLGGWKETESRRAVPMSLCEVAKSLVITATIRKLLWTYCGRLQTIGRPSK